MTEAEWLDRGDPILVLEAERGWPTPRKQRLFAVACCRRIAHLFPIDYRWLDGIEVAERYADRQTKQADLKATFADLQVASAITARAENTYADLLAQFATRAAMWTCQPTKRTYAGQVAINAACAAAYAALPQDERYVAPAYSKHARRWVDAQKAEVRAQIALLYDVCGHPFRPAVVSIGPLTREVVRLAQAADAEGVLPSGALDLQRLAVLADALEEAGCASSDVLDHLRSPGPHVRGCWALDRILDKE